MAGRASRGVAVTLVAGLLAACGAAGVGQPRLAEKPADYVAVDQNLPSMGGTWDPEQARLVGPHVDLQVERYGVTAEDQVAGYRAAAGHEFVQVTVAQPRGARWNPDAAGTVSAAVVVDGSARPLPRVPNYALVVSVPVGRPVSLQVTDDGRTQTLDLRTGRRGPDAVAGYYDPRSLVLRGGTYRGSATGRRLTTSARIDVQFEVGAAHASLEPWVPGYRWAATGRTWLLVRGVSTTVRTDFHDPDPLVQTLATVGYGYRLDWTAAASLTAAGASFPVRSGAPEQFADSLQQRAQPYDVTLLLDVPAGFDGGQLRLRPAGTVVDHRGNGRLEGAPPVGFRLTPFPASTVTVARA